MNIDVYVYKMKEAMYCESPFNPQDKYPEFTNLCYTQTVGIDNEVYEAVRALFYELGYDKENYGKISWNPLKKFVQPGEKVFIKPNLVFHEHPNGVNAVLSMITNAAILRPIIDYVLLATNGNVELIIGDAPVQGADFNEVVRISGIQQLIEFYENVGVLIKLIDMRMIISTKNRMGLLANKNKNPQRESYMYKTIDLKEKSELYDVIDKANRFEITDYGKKAVLKHHSKEVNEYIIPKEVLEADLFINVPKLKTHRKAGITCAMKNLVGINGDKTCLAHHTSGIKKYGGDEFSENDLKTFLRVRLWAFLKRSSMGIKIASLIKWFFQTYVWHGQTLKEHTMVSKPKVLSEGSWYGNDTIWRCVKDLNKIILYADTDGKMQDERQRKYLCVVDAVLAGEKEGPMEQSTKEAGMIFGGENAVYIDFVAAGLMCYDYKCIPVIYQSLKNRWWSLVEKNVKNIRISSNRRVEDLPMYFIPSFGWQEKLKEYDYFKKR